MDSLHLVIGQYGVVAVFLGTFLEGETIVVVAGFLSHQGLLNPYAVGLAAFAGSFLGDQLWFYLGRRHAAHPFVARVARSKLVQKVLAAIEDHPNKFILSFRFIYGIRTVSPVAIGMSKIPARKFLLLNAIAAALWAVVFTALGYVFGQAIESILGDIKAIEQKILIAAGLALGGFVLYQIGWRLRRNFRRNAKPETGQPDDSQ